MRKRIAILLAALLCLSALGFAACGAKEDEITIVASNATKKHMSEVIDAYNATNPAIRVRALYNANQDGFINANKAPDLIFTNNLDAENKYRFVLEDLSPFIERDGFDTGAYYGGVIENMVSAQGELRGIPVSCNLSLLYYNRAMFDAYNADKADADKLSYPDESWTLADFSDACQKLTVRAGGGVKQYGAELTDSWWGEWLIYVRSFGGDFMSADESDVALDTPQAKAGFKFMYELYTSGTATRIANSFLAGNAAMLMGGHTGNWLSYNAVADFDWDVAPLPTVTKGERLPASEITADVYGISKTSAHKEDAWQFLKFLTGYEGQSIISRSVSAVSCLKAVGNDALEIPYADRKRPKNLEAIYDVQLDYVKPLPAYSYFRTLHDNYVGPYIVKLFEGNYVSAGDATRQVDAMLADAMPRARAFMADPS